MPFAGEVENIPYGWLLCDGSEISRSQYSNLYSAIGVCWGTGNGSTTFNLPDLRGMFLRGVSGDSENDPDAADRIVLNNNGGNTGNNVGSYQSDAIRNITGSFTSGQRWINALSNEFPVSGVFTYIQQPGGPTYTHESFYEDGNLQYNFNAADVVPVGSDNRPKNVYVNYIIKY